ncbi:glycoside hydrolase family 3 C-terminal domain-containing protein [Alkalibacter saccharofermentans]|uniref:Beta-glucosidase n=1 Tax=Alkalibacter saccharofermentans DSM 14828 TaxID=1120975 RepID=A0A1M4T2U1_9FIRM|nr:glycoside hydrolase family 3 C-terminal domain-containing protein [Alkalibacter saccharofermentans]SHE38769.1 beta-glucosidase [Alkalibacter saccharofermentans DSM 14828]
MKYKNLIDNMTLEEKASLLSGKDFWMSKSIDRLNIPSLRMADGPHGIRKQIGSADHLGLNAGHPSTSFPTAATLANSWDKNLVEKVGELLGEEAKSHDVDVWLGPGLNIKRSPLCGRNFEYFSEDPYLSGKLAAALIKGVQSKGIAACPKHFAANNQELLRLTSDSVLDERTLHEIYLTGFEIAVKEGRPMSIMSAYNKINGVHANESSYLLKDLLVDKWGFEGFVVTDWGGSKDHVEAVKAGSHLEMPSNGGVSDLEVVAAVKNGNLAMEVLDERVDELLSAVFKIKKEQKKRENEFDVDAHHEMARIAAERSIVLLKNNDKLLPLKAGIKVAVIGDFAVIPRYQGAGSSKVTPTKMDDTLEMIENSHLDLIGYAQGFERYGKANERMKEEALSLARNADVVLLYLGLDESYESEGLDRKHMKIRENQTQLLAELRYINENIVVVLSAGSVVEMPWLDNAKSLLFSCLAGQAGASAIINIVTGRICPSGKLSETYPIKHEDTPTYNYFPGNELTAEYREGIYVGYRYYQKKDIPVRFPFGYGLSYTKFEYSDLVCSNNKVAFKIKNVGKIPGEEIAQLYVGLKDSKIFRASKELKEFSKVYLEPGEKKELEIVLDDKAFRYYNIKTHKFELETGEYRIMVGASSEDIALNETLHLVGTNADSPYDVVKLSAYYNGDVRNVSDEEFESLLNRPIPKSSWDTTKRLTSEDTISQLYYAKGLIGRLVFKILDGIKNRSEKKGEPNINILYIYNMPFRAISKMTVGQVDAAMIDDVLEMVNGKFFIGAFHLISSWFNNRSEIKKLKKQLENIKKENI